MLTITKCEVNSTDSNGKAQSGTAWFSDGKMYGFTNHGEITFYCKRKRGGVHESISRTLPKREAALMEYLTTKWDGKRHVIQVKL